MMQQENENIGQPEGTYTGSTSGSTYGESTATGDVRENGGVVMREKAGKRAEEVGRRVSENVDRSRLVASERLKSTSKTLEDLSERVSGSLEWAGESTRQGLHNTSVRVNEFANYLEECDSRQMWEDAKGIVRRHPGKSLLAGMGIGWFIGRLIR